MGPVRVRMRCWLWCWVPWGALLGGCPELPPLSVEASSARVEADGRSAVTLTVHSRDPIEGAVVQLTATGGALASSTAALVDGEATVALFAPRERELGRRGDRILDVTAVIHLSDSERLEARTSVTAVPPSTGSPLLFVDADPPAARAGSGRVQIHVVTRRIAAGAALTLTSSAGTVTTPTLTVDDDGNAVGSLEAPAAAADATLTVTDAGSGTTGAVVVRFVDDGQPLYDLTGSFAQLGPARVKLASGALTPNPQCALAPSMVLATFTQTGLDLEADYTTCDITFPPVTSLVGTVTNQATAEFYAAIPVVHAAFALASGELGTAYDAPPSVVVVGADLDDPEHDALPTDENDPRVVDADGDGAPGVTVQNSLGGDQHIVFRNIGLGVGRVVSSNHIVGDRPGDLLAATETAVFGIGNAFLPDTTALGSIVELVRIDGRFGSVDADADGDGAISCAELVDVAGSVATLEPPETAFDCTGEP